MADCGRPGTPSGRSRGDWLDWKLYNYRPSGVKTGRALARALYDVRGLWVPMNDRGGGYFPVGVSAVSGWELDDKVAFAVRLPRGEVGPQVDRALLRSPTRQRPRLSPVSEPVLRVGQVRRAQGQADASHPARSPARRGGADCRRQREHHHRARERPCLLGARPPCHQNRTAGVEPRQVQLPVLLARRPCSPGLPARVFEDRHRRTMFRSRADKAVKRLEEAGVVVERESGLWRIMPPDPSARELLALPPAEKL